jgi:hypothetical protein
MRLTFLGLANTKVSDLTPLQGMPLQTLDFSNTKVPDLKGIAGVRLQTLSLERTAIADLSPVKGMNLLRLSVRSTRISDLSPLKGMNLTFLSCAGAPVSDLSPLNGMPLRVLQCDHTEVSDEGLGNFKDWKVLTQLVLKKTNVTAAGIDALKKALPKCKTDWDGGVIEPMGWARSFHRRRRPAHRHPARRRAGRGSAQGVDAPQPWILALKSASAFTTVESNHLDSATRTKDMAPFAGQPRPPGAV